jgi:hypothetical protein
MRLRLIPATGITRPGPAVVDARVNQWTRGRHGWFTHLRQLILLRQTWHPDRDSIDQPLATVPSAGVSVVGALKSDCMQQRS